MHVFNHEESAKEYLLERGFYREAMNCSKCGQPMIRDLKRWVFRCGKRTCNLEKSLNHRTFLSNGKLKAHQMLLLARLWLSKVSISAAIELTGHSAHTVGDYWNFFRQLVSSNLDEDDTIIGGKGVIVEVDETKLGYILTHVNGSTIEGIEWRASGLLLV
jgi:hypothetical protein